jgi:hypothetical protein
MSETEQTRTRTPSLAKVDRIGLHIHLTLARIVIVAGKGFGICHCTFPRQSHGPHASAQERARQSSSACTVLTGTDVFEHPSRQDESPGAHA